MTALNEDEMIASAEKHFAVDARLRAPGNLVPAVRIRVWTAEEFFANENEWQDLLARSDADPLFMSWVWQSCWWRAHGKRLDARLAIYAAYSADHVLVGVAPFYVRKFNYRSMLRGTRVELLGSTFRDRLGAFSEYLDFIVDRHYADIFMNALKDALCHDGHWTDLVIANTAQSSIAARFSRTYLAHSAYLRESDRLAAHIAQFPQDFSDYLKQLRPGVRRKLWNHRSKLSSPRLVGVTRDGIGHFLDCLRMSHRLRWGASPHEELRAAFYSDIAAQFADRNELRMSYLLSGGEPISLMFNVRIGETEYNIQSGFDQQASPHASPGYLHFGFAMEAAHASGIERFNFLAGSGRNRDYKHDFLTREEELVTFQSVRSKPLAWLYRGYDRRFLSMIGGCAPCVGALLDAPFGDLGIL